MSRGFSPLRTSARPLRHLAPIALLTLFLVPAFTSSAHAQSAASWNKRGQAAEVREDYDAAYEAYKHAHEKAPKDLRYLAHFDRMRFAAAAQHIDRGRVLRQNGDFAGAISQFMRAAEIDKSNQAAQQEIERTQREQPPPGLTGPAATAAMEQMSQQRATLDAISSIASPVELKPVNNDPITLHMVEDVKNIYQAIGKAANINVLFDPEYTSKRIPIDLTSVSLAEALRIVGLVSNTLYKPVTSNTIFVAVGTSTRRHELEEQAVQTFYLSNSSQPNDGNEILTGLRLLLDPTVKLYLVPSQNAIVMRAPVDQLLLAQKLINDFDRARPEVVVDVAILEVNRDKIRNLGITLPTSFGLTPQIPTTSTTSATTTTSGTTASTLSLNNLAHLNATDFSVSITGGTLNALLSDTDTKVLQNPRIRATDNQKASLKIGQRIPVATGSYNSGVSTGVASIGVQTSFTYLDVGVNIDITPTVHYDREVTLKTKIEVSQQNGSVTISNVTEPIIAQRIIDQTVQLRDGEPSILAGILTKQDNHNVNGTPGLGEVPLLKYFFSSQNRENQQDEIVFLLIPHIVRESVLTRLNMAVIDTGTNSNFELQRNPVSQATVTAELNSGALASTPIPTQTTAASAANAVIQDMRRQADPTQPPPSSFTAPPAPAATPPAAPATPPAKPSAAIPTGPISLTVVPLKPRPQVDKDTHPASEQETRVSVMIDNAHAVYSVALQVQYDPHIVQLVNVDAGDFFQRDGKAVALTHRDDPNGISVISTARPPGVSGVDGAGTLCVLTFKTLAAGDSNVALTKVGAKDPLQNNIPAVGSQATIHVK